MFHHDIQNVWSLTQKIQQMLLFPQQRMNNTLLVHILSATVEGLRLERATSELLWRLQRRRLLCDPSASVLPFLGYQSVRLPFSILAIAPIPRESQVFPGRIVHTEVVSCHRTRRKQNMPKRTARWQVAWYLLLNV